MWSTSHFAQDSLDVAERRTHTRILVSPPIYASLDNINGGLIFNLTEEGLALTAAMTLAGEGRLGLRIYLPDSGGWIEATGQMAWRSETGKTVGVKIIGLTEDVRQRIRKWLAEESSRGELLPEAVKLPDPIQPPSDSVLEQVPIAPHQALLNSNIIAERRMLEAILSEDSFPSLERPAKVFADAPHQSTRVPTENPNRADDSPEFRQRRIHKRCQIRPLSYIELGLNNGGMLLNIGEGGFAVSTAECVTGDGFPNIRIQFTGSTDWIEASGKTAWISESKREAGIQFVNLTEKARSIIAGRISREERPDEFHVQSVKVPDSFAPHLESPKLRNFTPRDAGSENAVQEHLRAFVPSPLVMPGTRGNKAPSTVTAPNALLLKFWKRNKFKPRSRPAIRPVPAGEGAERLRRIAAAIILVVVTGAAIGWVRVSLAVRNGLNGFVAQDTKSTNKTAEMQKTRPATKTANVSALRPEDDGLQSPAFAEIPADHSTNRSESHGALVRRRMPGSERSSAAWPAVNSAAGHTVSPAPKNQSANLSQYALATATNSAPGSAGRRAVESSPKQPEGNTTVPSASPSMSLQVDPAPTAVKEKEGFTPSVKQPDVPVGLTWSVVVSTDPYPSIRIPPDVSSQKASGGKTLQIGRAVSRVEPIYPEEAKRQGIEGTVKLHVVVGHDGAVQSAEPMSGPDLLAKAATSAVREWRYTQTLLGGQPVETEQDIVVKFRLMGPTTSKN